MVSRRFLLSRLPLLAAGGVALYAVRDRLPLAPPPMVFDQGARTGWIGLPRNAGLIEIPGAVGGHPIRVAVDSGAQFSAIDRTLAERLGLRRSLALPMVAYGVSGRPNLAYMVDLDLALPGLTVRGLRAAALDIARLSAITGRGFNMLLGRDLLRGLVLEADMPAGRVAFRAPGAAAPPPDAEVIPLQSHGGAPVVDVSIEGAPLRLMVDTGATGAIALSEAAARKAGLLAPGRAISSAQSVSLGGLSFDRIVTARTVETAGLGLRDVTVQIYAPSAPAMMPEGLLGIGLLRRFRFTLDLPGRRLVLLRPTPMVVGRPEEQTS